MMMDDQFEAKTSRSGKPMFAGNNGHQPVMTKEQELEYRELQLEHGDDMSEVTLSTNDSSNQSDKNPSIPPRKWGLLWKTKSPLQKAKKIKKTMKKKMKREVRDSPEDEDVNETSKGWGWPSKSSKEQFFEGVMEEESEGPDDEIHQRQPVENFEDVPRVLADLNGQFCQKEDVDEYKLCRLELQQRRQVGPDLSAEEIYELELLQRQAAGEELYEESNDLDHFVDKRLMYKRLHIDLESMRRQQFQGEQIDQDLLFVLELFERRRLQVPVDIMEKLALDLLERDRLGENLNDGEMEELLDIMDMLKNKKSQPRPVEVGTKSSPTIQPVTISEKYVVKEASESDTGKGWGVPWGSDGPQQASRSVETNLSASRRGWLSYWRLNDQLQAVNARDKIQKELLDKSLLKARLLMEIDNLKMDLKKANTFVLQLGGEKDETTRVILNEGALPPEEMNQEPQESARSVEADRKDLERSVKEKDDQIAALEAQIRALRANNVSSARKSGRSPKVHTAFSIQDVDKLAAECENLKQQLKEINQTYAESQSQHQTVCWKLQGAEKELDQTNIDLEDARTQLDLHVGNLQNSSSDVEALNKKYDAALSKITKLEEDYPMEMRLRVTNILEGMGKSGGIEVLIDCYQFSEATIESLEVELTSSKQEAEAANMRQAEYCNAVAMCKKLEAETKNLQGKLQDSENEVSNTNEAAKRSMEEAEESAATVKAQVSKLEALSQQVQFLDIENGKLMEENIELRELCEEMITGMGAETLDC